MSDQTFVILGASLAGAKAAEELRERGFDGRVVLIGTEEELPYERPPLSKDYLRGESARDGMRVHDQAFYEDQEIDLRLGTTATAIDPAAGRIELGRRGELQFDILLLTTGSSPRRLQLPGAELDGIHYLRTIADCDAIRARFEQGGHVAVVGGGWIGSEVAASARQRGLDVTLILAESLPNVQVFGEKIGQFYRDVHARQGVELVLGDGATAFEGEGSVARVRTESGRVVECDFVVVGAGVTPNVELGQRAGLDTENGILANPRLQTSAPNVFVAGDVADHWHPFYEKRVHVEHWANALNQGPAAARSMLGDKPPYDELPYFFSDQYDVGMEYSGLSDPSDRVVIRGDFDGGEFIAFWLRDGLVTAGMNINVWDVNEHVQALIRTRKPVNVATLTDTDVPLESLV
ncbi:MAG TPA: FAD-dependent oxidoreductase [Solirubrobacteraceae bacterium]|jgi:3-phenylpropionate/trans-cinnamate dioxygenase ferredoxin reductase subunit|nr:FAD-dependent oxidoreductase [Solirubrobacteraceae bacterium]